MDEPTSALNEEETKNLFRIIRELAAQKIAIIYISHRMEEIFEISDRVMVMRDGKYVDDLPTAQTTREELIRLMVGRDIGAMFPARNGRHRRAAHEGGAPVRQKDPGRQLLPARGRGARHIRPDGRRTDRAGGEHLRRA